MRFVYSFLLFFLLSATFSARADQLIIEPDMGREPILHAIQDAKHSIYLVMYGWTDQALLEAIIRKKQQGNTVNIILESTPYKTESENTHTISELNNHHIAWQGHIPPFRLIHQKTLLLDNHQAIVMTFNFTHAAFKNQRNFALVIDDPQKVKQIQAIFSADWNHVTVHNSSPDLILSPDDSRQKIIALIMQAKQSIQIYAQHVSDYKIIGALAKAARKGVRVQLLTSTPLREKQEAYLTRAGVTIHYSKKFIIHAKVFNIDDQLAFLGSINLTRASLDKNRELSVLTHDPSVIKQLNATFQHDWDSTGEKPFKNIQQVFPDKHTVIRAIRLLEKYLQHI